MTTTKKLKSLFFTLLLITVSALTISCGGNNDKDSKKDEPDVNTFADKDAIFDPLTKERISSPLTMIVGEKKTITIGNTETYQSCDYPWVKWMAQNIGPTTVNLTESEGSWTTIRAIREGSASVTATDQLGGSRSITVNVKEKEDDPVNTFKSEDVICDASTSSTLATGVTLKVDDTKTIYIGNLTTGKSCGYSWTKWETSDASIISLNPTKGEKTTLTAKKEGSATISATDEAGTRRSGTVNVKAKEDGAEVTIPGYMWGSEINN